MKRTHNNLCKDNNVEDDKCCHNYRVPIKCITSKPIEFRIFPSEGISSCMWPYVGQKDYINPMFMIKIDSVLNEEVQFTCYPDVEDLRPKNPEDINRKEESHILIFTTSITHQD